MYETNLTEMRDCFVYLGQILIKVSVSYLLAQKINLVL